MTLISILTDAKNPAGFSATVSSDGEGEYPIPITDAFSEQEEKLLEWYFEEQLMFPFVKQVAAQTAAASITTYGEVLFKQLCADPATYVRYQTGVQGTCTCCSLRLPARRSSTSYIGQP